MSATPEKRPTARERARTWMYDGSAGEQELTLAIEAAERAARGDALEDAARVPAEAGLYGIVDRIRALKASAPPPAPPPPQVSAPAQAWPTTPLEMIDGRVAEHFLGHELNRIHPLEDRIAELEAAVGRHEHRLQAPPASEVGRAREAIKDEIVVFCRIGLAGNWDDERIDDALARLDAAKGGAA